MDNSLDPTPNLGRFDNYEHACREFQWVIPHRLNIADALCRRHSDAISRIALSDVKPGGLNAYTFGGLDFLSDKFATVLAESGIGQGDSIAVVLQPSAELAIAQLGALKTGAVVVPLSTSSDAALLEYAIADSGAKALVVDESLCGFFEAFTPPNPFAAFVVRDLRPSAANSHFKDFWSNVDRASSDFNVVETDSRAAALLFYFETQGQIVGVMHSHRSVIGQLAAFEMLNDLEDQAESVFWSAGDWATSGEALGMLYPAWWYGCSVVAGAANDDSAALRLLEQNAVTNILIPSPRLESGTVVLPETSNREAMRSGLASIAANVRTVVAETVLLPEHFVHRDPGVIINAAYGKPETGWIVGKCERWFATAPGAAGRPVPGRLIEIVDQDGDILPPGETGYVAVHKSDPALFTEYHGAPDKTAGLFIGDWFRTSDVGYKNGDGDFYISPSPSVVGAE